VELDDVVVRMSCHGHGIHATHRTDVESRVVATGRSFRFVWAYRGLVPAGCRLAVHHPRYYSAHQRLEDEFSQDVGTLVLETWDAFLDAGPTDPPAHSAYPWPTMELSRHLSDIDLYYIPAFPEAERRDLARHVPHLHRLFGRALATGAYGENENQSRNRPLQKIRDIEDTLQFAGSQTALFAAVAADDPARVREVIAAGAWLDTWDIRGYAPLHQAVRDDRPRAAGVLLELGADPNGRIPAGSRSLLDLAIRERHLAIVVLLLEHGVVLDRDEVKPEDLAGIMRSTAWTGDADSLRTFLAAGIEPDITQSNGYTALMDAAAENQLEIARILIEAGADVNACASQNRYPIKIARGKRHVEMVALLEQAGALETTPDLCEFTAPELHRAWWERQNAKTTRTGR
jgi:hypothetical protein